MAPGPTGTGAGNRAVGEERDLRRSTRLFLAGAILVAVGAGLFTWGATTGLTPAQGLTQADVMRTIGQVAGAVGGIGVAVWVIAAILRLRGR
jgi:hypothetical protein